MHDTHLVSASKKKRNLSIGALNFTSALAQFGQYGLGTTLIPIGLKVRNASAESIGFTSSAFWIGMLLGLMAAAHFTGRFGYRATLMFGVILSAVSFAIMPLLDWQLWFLPATIIGLGLGLRWIALETWLYNLVPSTARGRIVGLHETLLAFASILGPLLIVSIDAVKPDAFWIAAAVVVFGLSALPFVQTISTKNDQTPPKQSFQISNSLKFWLGFGALVAGSGGYVEGSLLAFIPVYSADIGYSASDAALLLTIFQIGAMAFQYPIGWLTDHYGLLSTTKLCAALAIFGLFFAIGLGHQLPMLSIATFIMGGAIASTLSLGLIWAIHNNTGAAMTYKVRQVSIVYTTLSAAGPLITGFMISQTGSASLFWQQLIVVLLLFILLIKHAKN